MSRSVLYMYMSMSLDGFIAGPNDKPGNPGGDGFMRLHDWYGFEEDNFGVGRTEWGAHFIAEINATGAVLAGRRTAEQVDHWDGNHHGVPIFVPSHRPPDPPVARFPLVKYVNDGIVSAMAQAKAAAGNRNVMVHGPTPRNGLWKPACSMNCRFTRSQYCLAKAGGCSKSSRRGSNSKSSA